MAQTWGSGGNVSGVLEEQLLGPKNLPETERVVGASEDTVCGVSSATEGDIELCFV